MKHPPPVAPVAPNDPLWAAILAESARQKDAAGADLDPEDRALLSTVEDLVAPYEAALTPESLDEARDVATVALVTDPDLERTLEYLRRAVPERTGARPKLTSARLGEAAARRRAGGGGKGT
jgi:hypothetical protein